MTNVVIWGAGGHAKVVSDILVKLGFRVCGFLDDRDPGRQGETFCGSRILGGADKLNSLWADGIRHAVVAFGDNRRRAEIAACLQARGFELARIIHPSATLASDVIVDEGSMVAGGAVINSATRVGRSVIVNTGATVDHDCMLEEGAQISPGVNIAGGVTIGAFALIGIGATIIENVKIGANSIVGAGAVVIADVPENVLVVGVPARVTKRLSL